MRSLVTYKPAGPLAAMDQEFGRFFDEFFGHRRAVWNPAADVVERDDTFLVRMDLPGLKREDINVRLEDGLLIVHGKRSEEHKDKNETLLRYERFAGEFTRQFRLGDGVSMQDIKASYRDGVLEIEVPKSERARPLTIEVK